mgnify:CR=1 FL=1
MKPVILLLDYPMPIRTNAEKVWHVLVTQAFPTKTREIDTVCKFVINNVL